MSLLLDALKQAEKQKQVSEGVEKPSLQDGLKDAENKKQSVPSITLEMDPVVEPTPTSIETKVRTERVPEPQQPNVLDDVAKTSIEDVALEVPTVERVDIPVVEKKEPKISQEKKESNSLFQSELDPKLNVFSVGNATSNKSTKKRDILMLFIAITLLMLGAWFYFSQDTNDESAPLIEDFAVTDDLVEDEGEAPTKLSQSGKEKEQESAEQKQPNKSIAAVAPQQIVNSNQKTDPDLKKPKESISITKRFISTGLFGELELAYQALKINDLRRAKNLYQSVLKRRPKQQDALLGLANIEYQQGNKPGSRALYERVLSNDETNTAAQIGLMQTYDDKNLLTKQQILEGLSKKHPNNVDIYTALGQSLSAQSKWLKAQGAYFKAFSINPNDSLLAFNVAVSLDQLGKYSAAKSYYIKAIKLNAVSVRPINISLINKRLLELDGEYE